MTTGLADHLLDRMGAAALETNPWAHAYLPDALPAGFASALADSFGAFGLTEFIEAERAKSYRLRTTEVYGPTASGPPTTCPLSALVDVVTSLSYRSSVSMLTGVDVGASPVTVDLWEYHDGDWLAPHVDKAEKVVTQIFYLTEGWAPDDGGRLLVLRSSSARDVHRALTPMMGSSAVLVRSAHSWHAVEQPGPGSPVRRSVTVTLWRGAGPAPRTV